MTKYYVPLLLRSFIGILLAILLAHCKGNESDSSSLSTDLEGDSIMVWIERSKDSNLSEEEQQEWLSAALRETDKRADDSLKTEYLSKISLAYLKRQDSLKFRETSKQTMVLAIKVADSVNLAESHWDLATFFRDNSIPDSAYYHYGEAHKIYKAMNDDLYRGRMLYNMAIIQARIKDYTGSEINTIRAIELLKPLKANRYLYNCYNNLGIVTKEMGEYERAIGFYDEALNYAREIDTTNSIANQVKHNKGNVYQRQGLHSKAIGLYKDALGQEDLFINEPNSYARTLANLAYSRLKTDDTLGVENQLLLALKIRDSLNDIEGLSINHFQLADLKLYQVDSIKAFYHAQKAVEYSKKDKNNKRLLLTYQLLPNIDPQNATTYANSYIYLNDSLQMQERKIRDKFARIQFETDEFIEQNRLLARQRQLWIGVATGVLLLAISIFIIINQRAKNQKLKFEQQQQEANQEIFDLMLSTSQKVEEGKHDEQKRISEELHDGVLGQMNGIRMVLLGLNKKTDDSAITMRTDAIEKLQDVQEEIRTISHELSDAAYQKFHNFIISIRDLVQSISQTSEIACEFTYDHDTAWDELSGEIKINLYRIVQEGLQNCIKYSQAKLIKLNFGADDSQMTICLEDDGVGFNSRKVKKGIGHKNISSRMKKIGGQWEVISAPGKGTKLNINVPYRWSAREQNVGKDSVLEKETFE